ncbi:Radical SAM domain protein [Syntrophobotulus glycolicus DSM 8271]|uniref:Radical SAM domain protein n=1 Tax=Syntrophobotulus glycolicus (strain DSM 8271 / FlGlyR) TaxID=645991 RepID=F0T1R0_SYNGF|nr:B12-binding domain-containing radical SAM protein [Syntrophobotulus glycolicus]ADY57484.1 Radical SAM domain protein [Syntrophobotulus glycolicus DSM 8271]
MKLLLAAINARYVHTNPAIRSLRQTLKSKQNDFGGSWGIQCKEFSINEQPERIAAAIYEEKPDFIGFSCYIWNIIMVLSLVRRLKLVLPETRFILGGPEVSYDSAAILKNNPQADAIIVGEGELILPELLQAWRMGLDPENIPGVLWRHKDKIVSNSREALLPELNHLPNPYSEPEDLRGKLVYVETTRGCPFHCSFCISSALKGVRYLESSKFRAILRNILQYGARTVKFVDRTFNVRKAHAFAILDIFKEEAAKYAGAGQDVPRAHCEMAGELLDEDWLDYLAAYPKGMLQLEIGVQSTFQPTLEAIARRQNFEDWQEKIRKIQHEDNIPVHLDLIAGLPEEGPAEFKKSFNDVYKVRPDRLQLGFLKVLKGSALESQSIEYGITYLPDPPYTVLQTKCLSHQEILELTRIEELLEKYYNSAIFSYSLKYAESFFPDAFTFYQKFAAFWHKGKWFSQAWKPKALFEKLCLFVKNILGSTPSKEESRRFGFFLETLKFDYYLLDRPGNIPDFLGKNLLEPKGYQTAKEQRRNRTLWEDRIPESKSMDKRQWERATAIDYFHVDMSNLNKAKDGLPQEAQGGWYLFYYGKDKKFFKCAN